MNLPGRDFLEITTRVGCPVGCSLYCPQDVLIKNYHGEQKTLTLDNFKIALGHLPARFPLVFSGFCEPFANGQATSLITYSHEQQHPVGLFTTLNGLSSAGLSELIKYGYFVFRLHLPDGQHMRIPLTEEYKDNVFTVLHNIPNVSFSIMNDAFRTDNRENFTQGIHTRERRWFRYCHKWSHPAFVMMPDGDVYLCCHDFGLQHKLGNLFTQSYEVIKRNYHPSYKLCRVCENTQLLPRYFAGRMWQRLVKE
jgi:hypothetical protein